jgi:hypothetical protein
VARFSASHRAQSFNFNFNTLGGGVPCGRRGRQGYGRGSWRPPRAQHHGPRPYPQRFPARFAQPPRPRPFKNMTLVNIQPPPEPTAEPAPAVAAAAAAPTPPQPILKFSGRGAAGGRATRGRGVGVRGRGRGVVGGGRGRGRGPVARYSSGGKRVRLLTAYHQWVAQSASLLSMMASGQPRAVYGYRQRYGRCVALCGC